MHFSSFTYLVRQGLHSLRANRMMTFASMGVLTVCMVLIGVAYLVGVNIDAMVSYIGQQNETVVYLDFNLSDEQIASADTAIRAIPEVASVTYVSPQDVLAQYSALLSDSANLQEAFANDNPFRANYRVVLRDVSRLAAVADELSRIPGVVKVKAPLELSNTFVSIQRVVNYASYGLVAVLALVSMVVVNNTIRITVFARRKEIAIMKLVGATNGFIRFPFFVEACRVNWLTTITSPSVSTTERFITPFSSSKMRRLAIFLHNHSISSCVSRSSIPTSTSRPFPILDFSCPSMVTEACCTRCINVLISLF